MKNQTTLQRRSMGSALFLCLYMSALLATASASLFGFNNLRISPVQAAVSAPAPEVGFVSQSPKLLWLAPNRGVTITLQVKNVSKKTWATSGANAVRLEMGKNSGGALRHKWWQGTTVAKLKKPTKPRGIATFRIPLQGPADIGYVEEKLELYQGKRKLAGGTFILAAIVGDNGKPALAGTVAPAVNLTVTAGSEQTIPLTITNEGRFPWKNKGYGRVRLVTATPNAGALRTPAWLASSVAAKLPTAIIEPGEDALVNLSLKAPTTPGTYQEEFALTATDIAQIPNSRVTVNVTVEPAAVPVAANEPILRVGLLKFTDPPSARITAVGPAALTDVDGLVLADSVSDVTLGKQGSAYTYTIDGVTKTSTTALRVEAPPTTILTVPTWARNDDAFRGTLEFRTADTGATWLINELPIETYLWGLAETGSTTPLEYRKSIITAARTYALYHHSRKTKHAGEYYDLNSDTDQVYRGYNYELRAPGVKEAVIATHGMVVFHPAAISELNPLGFALTAYSACTDGRTRSFQESFGGDGVRTPYLVSVPDPDGVCVNQRYLQGLDGNHMVGMSGSGAIAASRAGETFDQILLHYYTGVTLTQFIQ